MFFETENKIKLNGIALLVGMSLGLVGCQNTEDQAKERLKQGVELFKQGDYQKAQLELKSAIQSDGSVADSYYYMALLNEKDQQFKAMRENLEQTLKLSPNNTDARLKYGKVLLLFSEPDQAIAQAQMVLNNSADNLEALSLKAAALIKQKNVLEASSILDSILQRNPQYSPASALKIVMHIEQKEFDTALSLINASLATDANNLELHLLKIKVDSFREDVPAIIEDYQRLIALQPNNSELKIALAKIYRLAKKDTEAEALLNTMLSEHPEQIEPKLHYLEFLYSVDKAKAAGQLQTFIAEGQDKPALLLGLVQWLLATRQLDAAQSLLENSLPKDQTPEMAAQMQLMLAELKFNKKDFDGALRLVDDLLAKNSTNQPAKILKAKIHVAKKEYEPAIDLFTKVLWESPELDSIVVMLGEIELLRHDPDKADKKFREALDINPANMDALRAVTSRASAKSDNVYVDSLITRALQFKPDDIALTEQLANIKMLKQDWPAAKLAIETLEKNPNARPNTLLLKASLAQAQDNLGEAIDGYKQLLAEFPDNATALTNMTQCYEKLHQRGQMLNFLTTFIQAHPAVVPAYYLKSQLHRLDKNNAAALETLKQALAADTQNINNYLALGEFYVNHNDPNAAIAIYQQGLQIFPEHENLSIALAQVYETVKNYNQAISSYDAVIAKNPNAEVAINNLATLLIDHFDDEVHRTKARALAEQLQKSEQAYFLDTYGWIEFKTGDINKAITALEKVNVMETQVPTFKYHLGAAYLKQGNNAGAMAQLQEAIAIGKQKGSFAESAQAQQLLDKIKLAP